MSTLRKPIFVVALVLALLIVLVEVGGVELVRGPAAAVRSLELLLPADGDLRDAYYDLDPNEMREILAQPKPPGLAIRMMALLDGILLFSVGLIGLSLLITQRVHGRIQGIATLIFSFLLLLGTIVAIIAAVALLLLMVGLFLAVPFGTLAYLALYGFFNRGGASALLAVLMALKVGFAVCLVLAQQRFLENKGLVLMILTSLLANLIISLLHGIVPIILVSITDALAAIVVGILAAIWALVLLISAIPAVIKALRAN